MVLTIKKNLVSIDSMQFINSSLEALVRNLSDNNSNYLSPEFKADLEYPDELDELHNDYPLAPEKKINSKEALKLRSSSDKFIISV